MSHASTRCPHPALLLALAGAALVMTAPGRALAQPVWSSSGEYVQLVAQASAEATLPGPNLVTAETSRAVLEPGYQIGDETYQFGNEARAVAISVSGGPVKSSALSVTAIRGLGTPTVEIYFRTSTLDDASFPSYYYETTSHAILSVLYGLEVTGGVAGTAYHVTCNYEYFANAATQPEAVFDDRAATQGSVSLSTFVPDPAGPVIPFTTNFNSEGPPPFGTGGTLTGNISAIAIPDYFNTVPGNALFYTGLGGVDGLSIMRSPGVGIPEQDLCGSEVEARLLLTIGGVCPKPAISQHPVNTSVCTGRQTQLTVTTPAPDNEFIWQIADGVQPGSYSVLVDGPIFVGPQEVATVTGARTSTLMIHPSVQGPAILPPMRCMVVNACNGAPTNPAFVTILPANHPDCAVCDSIDFNHDDLFPDTADIDDFLVVFSGGQCSNDPHCGDIDFNNDTLFPDTRDIDALLSVFSGGPCLI